MKKKNCILIFAVVISILAICEFTGMNKRVTTYESNTLEMSALIL